MTNSEKKAAKLEADKEAVLKAIAAMPDHDRVIGEKLHQIISSNGPDLMPRTWYGMPAYSNGNKIVCFFRDTKKFGERYMTLGFNDAAKLDEGDLWPIVYAITELSSIEESKVAELIKKAVS